MKQITMLFVAVIGGSLFFSAVLSAIGHADETRGVAVVEKYRDSRQRVALVIGNSAYRSSPLKNPANDARSMAATLRRLGFEVEEKTDLGYIEMNKSVESFGKKLKSGGVGLFYYAGHGMQVNGANYLIPVDAQIEDENEVRFKAVDAGLVLAKMEQAKSDVNLIVLDACRDNPFSRSFRSSSHGLASMDAPNGTFIAYATAPGKTAADGDGRNGLYTGELVKVLETPGLPLEKVFKRALKSVREKSGNKQTPWVASNLEGEFYFTTPPGGGQVPADDKGHVISPEEADRRQHVAVIPRPEETNNSLPVTNRSDHMDHDLFLKPGAAHVEVIDGVTATFKIVEMNGKRHIAVEFKEPNSSKALTNGVVSIKVQNPDKSTQTKNLPGVQGYFAADFELLQQGKYGVMCKFKLEDGKVRSTRFWYTVQ